MGTRRITGAAAVVVALLLSGCTVALPDVVGGSVVAVGVEGGFTSYNAGTSYGSTPTNVDIAYATNTGFNYYDDELNLVRDESFGSYEKLADEPLTVRYTVADGVTWSDGTAVDAADLLLEWVAASGAYNATDFDPADFKDPETGAFTEEFPDDVVYFDSGANPDRPTGIGLVSRLPEISDDRKSITLVYDAPYVDWELAFYGTTSTGLPAHVAVGHALGIEDPQDAKDALVSAVVDRDEKDLASISAFWNTGFIVTDMPEDPSLVVGSGPYIITDLVAGQYVELTANELYTGARQPHFGQVLVRFVDDPLAAVQALMVGAVQVITPQANPAVLDALRQLDSTVVSGYEATFEHLDLQFEASKSGHFGDPRVREAFLKTIPRQQIVDDLVVPLWPDAATRDSLLFTPGAEGYAEAVAANGSDRYAHVDIEGAKALLAEAGVASPEACILYGSTNPRRANEFALIQASAGLAGFRVTDCSAPDWRSVLGTSGAYDAALFGWQSANLGVTGNSVAFRSDGINNYNHYSNPEVDDLLQELDRTFDAEEQLAVLQHVDALLFADFGAMPLFQFPVVAAFDQDAVDGISPSTLQPTVFWNVWEWSPVPETD
ncbi:MAG: ABC transporter family substrate-binding protein [Rhodoglobus sp.]